MLGKQPAMLDSELTLAQGSSLCPINKIATTALQVISHWDVLPFCNYVAKKMAVFLFDAKQMLEFLNDPQNHLRDPREMPRIADQCPRVSPLAYICLHVYIHIHANVHIHVEFLKAMPSLWWDQSAFYCEIRKHNHLRDPRETSRIAARCHRAFSFTYSY